MTTTTQELTPARLIELYCLPELESSWQSTKRDHSTWHAGAISYSMCYGREHDGYDDGYDFMEALADDGWRIMPNYGDWPYLVYMCWAPRESDPRPCIAHYCEGDFGIEVFDSIEAARAAAKELTPAP